MKVAFVGNPGHFHNEIDLAGSECLDGKKFVKFTPWKIISSSPLGTPRLCRHMVECTITGLRQQEAVSTYWPEQLDKEVTTPHFTAIGVHSQLFPRNMQITLECYGFRILTSRLQCLNMLVQLESVQVLA